MAIAGVGQTIGYALWKVDLVIEGENGESVGGGEGVDDPGCGAAGATIFQPPMLPERSSTSTRSRGRAGALNAGGSTVSR